MEDHTSLTTAEMANWRTNEEKTKNLLTQLEKKLEEANETTQNFQNKYFQLLASQEGDDDSGVEEEQNAEAREAERQKEKKEEKPAPDKFKTPPQEKKKN